MNSIPQRHRTRIAGHWIVARWVVAVATITLIGGSAAKTSADWPRFHGADSTGRVADGTLPDQWSPADYAWTVKLGGKDVGSPVIFGQRVFLTDTAMDRKSVELVCIDLNSGGVLWRRPHQLSDRRRHARNSAAATTPAVDADYVYMAHGDAAGASIMAYTHEGEKVWERDLGTWEGQHGFSTSPLVVGDTVVLFNEQDAEDLDPGHTPGESRMEAMDRHTGESLWSTPLKTTRVCYGVPAVYTPQTPGAAMQLVAANTGNGLFGLDAATGEMLWSMLVFDKRCCNSPTIVNGLAVASCGSGGGGNILSAVRIPETSNQSPEEVFRIDRSAPYVPSPAVRGDWMFIVSDNGIASCLDVIEQGETIWSTRLGGNFGASPIIVGDKVLFLSLDGKATVMSATDQKQLLGQFNIGDSAGASPSYSQGRLVFRIDDQLNCLDTRGR